MLVGLAYGSETEFGAGIGRQDDIKRAYFGHVLEQPPWCRAEARAFHPLLKIALQDQGQDSYEDVGLGSFGSVAG